MVCVKLHLKGQTDEYQRRRSRIYETAGSLEPTQNDAFSLKTEQSAQVLKTYTSQIDIVIV